MTGNTYVYAYITKKMFDPCAYMYYNKKITMRFKI